MTHSSSRSASRFAPLALLCFAACSSSITATPDAGSDAPVVDTPPIDTPTADAPVTDAPVTDAPLLDRATFRATFTNYKTPLLATCLR